VGLEPTHRALTGRRSAAELPTLHCASRSGGARILVPAFSERCYSVSATDRVFGEPGVSTPGLFRIRIVPHPGVDTPGSPGQTKKARRHGSRHLALQTSRKKFGVTSAEDEREGHSPIDRPDARPFFVQSGNNNASTSSFFQRVRCSGYRPATRSTASYTYLDAATPPGVHEKNRNSFRHFKPGVPRCSQPPGAVRCWEVGRFGASRGVKFRVSPPRETRTKIRS
jgi:hypothetical protein